MTVGGRGFDSWDNQKTEIIKMDENKKCSWSVVEPDSKFGPGESIYYHSLVTVESSDINEEYVLLIGGLTNRRRMKNIFKFNGTWLIFGQLKKPRRYHNSIYLNGAVYVIGGRTKKDGFDVEHKTKIEIWNIKDSPDQFKTKENWPELFSWDNPHLFIVPDSFFPDHRICFLSCFK